MQSEEDILKHHKVKLLKILPLENEIFLAKLGEANLLPEGSGAFIRAKSTRDEKVSYFLEHIVEPAPDVYLDLLIGVMEKSDNLAVTQLANNMKRRLRSGHKGIDLKHYKERFSNDDVESSFLYLLNKLDTIWSEVDIHIFKKIYNRDIRFSNELRQGLDDVSDVEKALNLLSRTPFCTWLDITILKRMADAAEISEATQLLNTFEECVHRRKCSKVKLLHFKKLYINPAHLESVRAKLNENAEHLIVADLINYCHKLESVLDVPNGSSSLIGYSEGCLEIHFVIPTYCCLHAYKIAKNNTFKFQSFHIQYLQIGTFPKVYTANLNENKNANCLLERLSLLSKFTNPSEVIACYYTYLMNYMDADAVSHMMHCDHLISDDDYQAIIAAPNQSKMNMIILEYVRAMDMTMLHKFADLLINLETQQSVGDKLKLALNSANSKYVQDWNIAETCFMTNITSEKIIATFLNLLDELVTQMSTADVTVFTNMCSTLMASSIHQIPLFKPEFMDKLINCTYPFIFKMYLLPYVSWFDCSLLKQVVIFSDNKEALKMMDSFVKSLDYSKPITSYHIPEVSQLHIPLNNSHFTLLATIHIKNMDELILQDVLNIKQLLVSRLEVTDYAVQLIAIHHASCCFYWLIPDKIQFLIKDKLSQNQLKLYDKGIVLIKLLSFDVSSDEIILQQNNLNLFHINLEDPQEVNLMKQQFSLNYHELSAVVKQNQEYEDKLKKLGSHNTELKQKISVYQSDLKRKQTKIDVLKEEFKSIATKHKETNQMLQEIQRKNEELTKENSMHLNKLKIKNSEYEKQNIIKSSYEESMQKMQKTPLHYAAQNGYTESVALLVDSGADVNKKDTVS